MEFLVIIDPRNIAYSNKFQPPWETLLNLQESPFCIMFGYSLVSTFKREHVFLSLAYFI